MRRSRVTIAEKKATESKTKYNSSQRKVTSVGPRITRKNFSVSMVNTRSSKEIKTKECTEGKQTEPADEIDLETPDQRVDEVEKKTTESTPIPNAEEKTQKSMGFSPIDTVEDTTCNTPETVKDESQVERTSFTERIAMMIGMKSRDIVADELGDLMANLDQIDKKLKHSEEDREVIKKELRYNKHEYLDNYFNLARATEEKL